MLVPIEIYRGWEISFDTDAETFTGYSSTYDDEVSGKVSFAACKKHIDAFIKENNSFKPMIALSFYHRNFKEVKVIGIRKDGAFTIEDEKGNKSKLGSYEMSDCYVKKGDYTEVQNEYNSLNEQADGIREKARNLLEKYKNKLTPMSEIKKQYEK